MTFRSHRPLFIPLKAQYFEAFAKGEKHTEYRRLGPRWNAKTCWVGRRVILSYGYGKRRRMEGTVTGYRVNYDARRIPGWIDCFGPEWDMAAEITIVIAREPNNQPTVSL